ncbi:MAG: RelA/SpoT family protein [Candidatus Magasanikbacteria bacterium]
MIAIPQNLDIELLLKELKKYSDQKDLNLVRSAYDFAFQAHTGQTRKSGELYINHPLAAAHILTTMRIEPSIIAAALLHDVPEDTKITLEEIEKKFGKDIASIVKGITKLGTLKYRGIERYIENLRKMFVAMAEDVRVMIVKFADRVHNLMTLEAHQPNKRYRIALESLEIYAPIANRLGMGEFKGMLEDLSFPYIYPKEYEKVKAIREEVLKNSSQTLEKTKHKLNHELKKSGITVFSLHNREKQLYSLYQKLLTKNWEIDKIYDIIALRIIVKDISDCYATLGIVHQLWHPLKGRIKDYVAQPKPNGYQSLHTTVFGENGKIMEFQIRTQEMHDDAEYGAAAHWHYDEHGKRLPNKNISWAKELAKLQKEILNNLSDLEEMKIDFFRNHIFVFTPKGDVIDLPEDATPVDFAYHIHTDIGDHCSGAKVNDQLVSLNTPLKNGDVIDIIISKDRKGPSPDWLKSVKTHGAKIHIKNSLNKSKLEWLKSILPGKNK